MPFPGIRSIPVAILLAALSAGAAQAAVKTTQFYLSLKNTGPAGTADKTGKSYVVTAVAKAGSSTDQDTVLVKSATGSFAPLHYNLKEADKEKEKIGLAAGQNYTFEIKNHQLKKGDRFPVVLRDHTGIEVQLVFVMGDDQLKLERFDNSWLEFSDKLARFQKCVTKENEKSVTIHLDTFF